MKRPTDFAFRGVRAGDAYQSILEECALTDAIDEETPSLIQQGWSPVEMRLWIEESPTGHFRGELSAKGYDEVTQRCARAVLAHYEAHPGDLFCEERFVWQMLESEVLAEFGVDAAPSCFQWGWSINAARYVLGWMEMPNPAFLRHKDRVLLAAVARDEYDSFLQRLQE